MAIATIIVLAEKEYSIQRALFIPFERSAIYPFFQKVAIEKWAMALIKKKATMSQAKGNVKSSFVAGIRLFVAVSKVRKLVLTGNLTSLDKNMIASP